MEKELLETLDKTYEANGASEQKHEKRLLPKDEKTVNDVIGTLNQPDKLIISASKIAKSEVIERIKSMTLPVVTARDDNNKVTDVQNMPAIYLIAGSKNEAEVNEYLSKTNANQLIVDLKEKTQKIVNQEGLQDYYKEKNAQNNKKSGASVNLFDEGGIEQEREPQFKEDYEELEDNLKNASLDITHFSFLGEGKNVDPQTLEKQLKTFIFNFVTKYLDNSKNLQLEKADENGQIEKEMFFVLGAPGAGKSSTISSLKEKYGAFHAEADEIKMQLAEMFGVDVNHDDMHQLSGEILKNFLLPQCKRSGIKFILEKIGDEPHKIAKLAKDCKKEGYKTNLSCIHVDIQECRLRNINRAVDYLKEGKFPRMVNDEETQKIGYNPLITYIYLTQNEATKDLFDSGECLTNQNPKELDPQYLLTLNHGEAAKNEYIDDYIKNAEKYKEQVFEEFFAQYIKSENLTEEQIEAINEFKDKILHNPSKINKDNFKELTKQLNKVLKRSFNPKNIISSDPAKPFGDDIDAKITLVNEKKRKETQYNPNIDRIKSVVNEILEENKINKNLQTDSASEVGV